MNIGNQISKLFRKKKVALVLGGGSARGMAHIGVLKVFQKENIKFDLIVGTSIGAFIGAYYALGKDIRGAEEMALKFNVNENLDLLIPPTMGIIKGNRIHHLIKSMLDNKMFSDAKTPFAVVAADIENGEEVVFTEGPLSDAVRVSCSYPGIFVPQRIDGKLLVDGGILNTVPVSVARRMGADIVVAVDVGFCVQAGEIKNIFGIIFQTYQIMGDELNRYQSQQADIVLRPNLAGIDQLAFTKAKMAIESGEVIAVEKLPEIKRKLNVR
ncbi:MAG: patatin-like phospholipase family protein [Candidatus Omnitrophica bacterium]|nr:patatin-like phospholipase family protein [Candidatus Omnitrophota bacterium]